MAQLEVQGRWDPWCDHLGQSPGTSERQGAHRREEKPCGGDLIQCFLLS